MGKTISKKCVGFILLFLLLSGAASTMASDRVVTGKMKKYSKKTITVSGVEYALCSGVKVVAIRDKKISMADLEAAETVQLSISEAGSCIKRIKILKSAI